LTKTRDKYNNFTSILPIYQGRKHLFPNRVFVNTGDPIEKLIDRVPVFTKIAHFTSRNAVVYHSFW